MSQEFSIQRGSTFSEKISKLFSLSCLYSPKKLVMDETITVKRLSGGNSIHTSSPSSTYTPLEIIQETILCRLPVKSLQRFRCVCKPWDSLISKDLKFAKNTFACHPNANTSSQLHGGRLKS
ncbi:F-box/kelch-repeat protein [Trifolium repens]|nr:F-box/kelch-repeat protein [Trifolium repens]